MSGLCVTVYLVKLDQSIHTLLWELTPIRWPFCESMQWINTGSITFSFSVETRKIKFTVRTGLNWLLVGKHGSFFCEKTHIRSRILHRRSPAVFKLLYTKNFSRWKKTSILGCKNCNYFRTNSCDFACLIVINTQNCEPIAWARYIARVRARVYVCVHTI